MTNEMEMVLNFSFMKLVNIFSINPHLGPLQISLGRMIIDIIKFFFIYTLVLFSFGCGKNESIIWLLLLYFLVIYIILNIGTNFSNEIRKHTVFEIHF